MKLLIDARSVRTPSGLYVFQGLTSHWLNDPRVEKVVAALPDGFDRLSVPAGVETVTLPNMGWLLHVMREIPRVANECGADIIFSPNASAPPDPRAVLFFQDLHHFVKPEEGASLKVRAGEAMRTAWRGISSPRCLLAVTVSEVLAKHVRSRVHLPISVIPHGIEVGSAEWRGGGSRCLVMGGIGGRKGESLAVQAWAKISAADRSGAFLDVVGVEPAERRVALESLSEALGCGNSVSVSGTMPRELFLDRIAGCVMAISCTRFESFGLPVAEALVVGAPVACTNIPPHRELLSRAGAGELFATGDVGALAEVMRTALTGSAPSRAQVRRSDWGWAARAGEHLDAYADSISRRPHEYARN